MPIASRPTRASLKVAQPELSGNAASIHTKPGGGQHGCIASIIKQAAFLRLSNEALMVPPNPPTNPTRPTGASQPCIAKDNRRNVEKQRAFRLCLDVDTALKNQIIASLPDNCARKMKRGVAGRGSVKSLTLS